MLKKADQILSMREGESILNHDCQYQVALAKAEKSVATKNRQIVTLNRIIKNLKDEIVELTGSKQNCDQQIKSLKEEIEQLKRQIKLSELQRINEKEQYLEQFMKTARDISQKKIKEKRPPSKLSHQEKSRTQYSQGPRYSFDLAQQKMAMSEKVSYSSRPISPELNMGELFMGKRMTVNFNENHNHNYKLASWGKIEELKKTKKIHPQRLQAKGQQFSHFTFSKKSVNFESMINDLRRQNQQLKISLF